MYVDPAVDLFFVLTPLAFLAGHLFSKLWEEETEEKAEKEPQENIFMQREFSKFDGTYVTRKPKDIKSIDRIAKAAFETPPEKPFPAFCVHRLNLQCMEIPCIVPFSTMFMFFEKGLVSPYLVRADEAFFYN